MQSDRSRKLGKFVCTYQFRAKVKTVFIVVGFFVIHVNLDLFGLQVIELQLFLTIDIDPVQSNMYMYSYNFRKIF